jgi:hypothetical protein
MITKERGQHKLEIGAANAAGRQPRQHRLVTRTFHFQALARRQGPVLALDATVLELCGGAPVAA